MGHRSQTWNKKPLGRYIKFLCYHSVWFPLYGGEHISSAATLCCWVYTVLSTCHKELGSICPLPLTENSADQHARLWSGSLGLMGRNSATWIEGAICGRKEQPFGAASCLGRDSGTSFACRTFPVTWIVSQEAAAGAPAQWLSASPMTYIYITIPYSNAQSPSVSLDLDTKSPKLQKTGCENTSQSAGRQDFHSCTTWLIPAHPRMTWSQSLSWTASVKLVWFIKQSSQLLVSKTKLASALCRGIQPWWTESFSLPWHKATGKKITPHNFSFSCGPFHYSRERLSEGFFKKEEVQIDLHIQDLLISAIFLYLISSHIW